MLLLLILAWRKPLKHADVCSRRRGRRRSHSSFTVSGGSSSSGGGCSRSRVATRAHGVSLPRWAHHPISSPTVTGSVVRIVVIRIIVILFVRVLHLIHVVPCRMRYSTRALLSAMLIKARPSSSSIPIIMIKLKT